MLGLIAGIVSAAVGFISTAVSTIGPAISSLATTIVKLLPSVEKLSSFFNVVGMLFKVLKPNENVEELGAKALVADKKPEDFDSIDNYIDYLRNEVELDIEEFEKADEKERLARTAVGSSIVIKGIEENKGKDVSYETVIAAAKIGLDKLENKKEEIDAMLENFRGSRGIDLLSYVEGKASLDTEKEIGDKLVEMYKKLEPEKTEREIERKAMSFEGIGKENKL